jgi:glycosyltransferase involved in cell wall biosynthesis
MTEAIGTEHEPEVSGLVSVVIIFLNEERYLRESVCSVLNQDYPNWELLLVDDGSTDSSSRIAQDIAAGDSRIRYFAHPEHANRGMSASRNLGLAHARGEYVAFLDADDVYLPERLRHHVDILKACPHVAMTVSDHFRWLQSDIDPEENSPFRPWFALGDQCWQPPMGLLVVMAVPYLALGICNVTVRRKVAYAVGGFENQFTSMFEDQAFTSKVLARYPVYVLQKYLARYRHHSQSWTRKIKESGVVHRKVPHGDLQRFCSWLAAYLRGIHVEDPLLFEVLGRRLESAGTEPGATGRAMIRVSASAMGWARRFLPETWYHRLLILDYQRDRRHARRQYDALALRLSKRAADEALRGHDL